MRDSWIVVPALLVFCLGAFAGAVAAQEGATTGMPPEMEAFMKAMTPGEAHKAMAEDVGTFKLHFESWMSPGGDPVEGEGVAERSMTMGGRILEERVRASMMGMPFEGVGQSGYDNVTGRYWSTWVDSMSTGIWFSHGSMDDAGVMTFRGESSDPMTGGMKPMKVVIHPEKEGVQISEFFTPDESGAEFKMMVITYTRQDA